MVYLVSTKFRAGIYFSRGAIEQNMKDIEKNIQKYEKYEEAYNALKEMEKNNDFCIPWDEFIPNRLYQIKDDRLYQVLYNSREVGFIHRDDFARYVVDGKRMMYRFSKLKNYRDAQQMVWSMGACTDENPYLGKKAPVCGKIYLRIKNF